MSEAGSDTQGSVPMYSYTREQAGMLPMVISVACAEWRCGDCAAWFRCDCAHHRPRPGQPGVEPAVVLRPPEGGSR